MWQDLPIVIRRRVHQQTGHRKQSVLASARGFHIHGVRELEAGDSPRSMSRKHLVRTGTELVVEKHMERGAFVLVLLDVSASGRIGAERIKHDASVELLDCFARACLWQGNILQVIAFTANVEFESPVLASANALDEILIALSALRPVSQGTDHREVIAYASSIAERHVQPADLVCIISDLLFPEPRDSLIRDLEGLSETADVVALVMRDSTEMAMPPLRGSLRARDIETGEVFLADAVSDRDPVRELEEHDIDSCVLMTSQSEAQWFDILSDFFTRRIRRG